jgi:hypothetical protein
VRQLFRRLNQIVQGGHRLALLALRPSFVLALFALDSF